jgi:ribosomal protein S18 acetylase RimI-like enzyme
MTPPELVRLEAIAFRAWPAASVTDHRGMLLRITGGDSRRANSAAVFACDPRLGIDELTDAGEAFYRARGQRALFQVGPTAPAGLDAALASRGYGAESPVWVQTTKLGPLVERARATAGPVRTSVASSPDASWVDIEIARGRYAGIAGTFLGALAQLGSRAGFATAHVDGAAVAACLFVHDEDLLVLAAMRTLPEARRRGAARALVHAGALWAAERGADAAILQVDQGNDAALTLYASEGFVTQYGYHYRGQGEIRR